MPDNGCMGITFRNPTQPVMVKTVSHSGASGFSRLEQIPFKPQGSNYPQAIRKLLAY